MEKPLADLEGGTNVSEKYKDYIKSNIIKCYKRKIIAPLVYLAFILLLIFISPIYSILNPNVLDSTKSIKEQYNRNGYITAELKNLYFTGYTKEWLTGTEGYYYYTNVNDDCVIVLLTPDTCEQGKPIIEDVTIKGKIYKNSKTETELLNRLAKDLSWDEEGITSTLSSYNINEPATTGFLTWALIILALGSGIVSLIFVIIWIIHSETINFYTCATPQGVWQFR